MTLNELITSLTEQTKALKNELQQNGDRTLDFDVTLTTKAQALPTEFGGGQTNVQLGFVEINTPNGLPNFVGIMPQAIILPMPVIGPMVPQPPMGVEKTVQCPICHNTITV